MNEILFRTLLLQSEGPELDFKRDQYAFKGADDFSKSKLLKDVLTFSNSWRLGDAYVLIGVEDLNTGARDARGIPATDHIDDASLQQFVNSKINRDVNFRIRHFCTMARVSALLLYLNKNGRFTQKRISESSKPTRSIIAEEAAARLRPPMRFIKWV